jgi:formylglycine-generating enzyme
MRRVHERYAPWLMSKVWTPLADHPGVAARVYASRWEQGGIPLWTVVNRGDAYDGPWIVTEARLICRWLELTTGTELQADPVGNAKVAVGGALPAGGVVAVLATREAVRLEPHPPADGDPSFSGRVAIRVSPPVAARTSVPLGMKALPGGRHALEVRYRLRETGLYGETPFVDEWKSGLGTRLHVGAVQRHAVHLAPFAIGVHEVTNAEYAAFLTTTGYAPVRPDRLLAHWCGNMPPEDGLAQPVTTWTWTMLELTQPGPALGCQPRTSGRLRQWQAFWSSCIRSCGI